jgi:hypothetical protein
MTQLRQRSPPSPQRKLKTAYDLSIIMSGRPVNASGDLNFVKYHDSRLMLYGQQYGVYESCNMTHYRGQPPIFCGASIQSLILTRATHAHSGYSLRDIYRCILTQNAGRG